MRGTSVMEIQAPADSDTGRRERALQQWYRRELRLLVPPLLAKWETALGVHTHAWGIKKMKTKWGSCNPDTGRIWLNLELAKKPVQCLEYLLVHELVHLIERHHGDRFIQLMDQHLPSWEQARAELNRAPLCYEDWQY